MDERERKAMNKDSFVKINFNDIFWNIHAKLSKEKNGNEPIVEMEWGWSAGETEEEERCARINNRPTGRNGVRILLHQAERLRDNLDKIVKQAEEDKTKQ